MSQMDDDGEMSRVSPGDNPSFTDDAGSSSVDADVTSGDVHSRLSMSDEQREIKRRFEEKQREEARRSAHAERIAKKKAIKPHSIYC